MLMKYICNEGKELCIVLVVTELQIFLQYASIWRYEYFGCTWY